MKRLLRSILDVDGKITQENLVQNFQRLFGSHIEWSRPDDQKVYDYVLSYFQQRYEVPALQTVKDYFDQVGGTGDIEVLERLKDIEASPAYIRTNFTHLLQSIMEEQNKVKAVALLKETQEIITKGLDFKEGREKVRKQGVREGVTHFSQRAFDLIQVDYSSRTRGDIRQDGQAMMDEYETAKVNKDKVWGRFTGLNEIDKVCHGAKPGELWVHAAFPGELKTSFACNWAYNLVTRYRSNVLYFSLEMPYEQLRRNFYVMHSAHAKWASLGYKPLDYRKVRDGELTPEEEAFYKVVVEDFSTNPEYCELEIISPDRDMTIKDIKLEAEMLHKQMEVGLIVIDHGQLVEASKKGGKDYVVELNSIVRDAKKLALHFNHGEKVPVLMLFQINRQGKEEADKAEGVYKASAIAYANEVEKSADIITTTYLNDEHRRNGTTKFCNLKNRDNPKFDPFTAKVDFAPRRIRNMDMFRGAAGRGMGVDDHAAALQAMMEV